VRDRIYALLGACASIVFALAFHLSGILSQHRDDQYASVFFTGLIALTGVVAASSWYAWKRARGTARELAAFRKEDEVRRAIAAIGVGATWDLDLHRILTRFAHDLKQLIEYDRLAMTTARQTGGMELLFLQGEHTESWKPGTPVPLESPEPDGFADPTHVGLHSRLTVPFLAVNGTLTLRSRRPGAYGQHHLSLLRQVVAQATPGVANAMLFSASQRQLAERTALADIGRAATGKQDLHEIFPMVQQSLAALIRFDHLGVVLASQENGRGKVAYWQVDGLMGLHNGSEVPFDSNAFGSSGVLVGRKPAALDGRRETAASEAGVPRLWLQAPLRVQDELLGVLFLSAPGDGWAGREESQLVEQVSLQVAPAIKNAKLLGTERSLKDELDRQNRELQAAQEAKNRFLSAVSHELRTPLAIISGFIDLLKSNQTGNLEGEQLDTLQIMGRNAKRLSQLIGDLLDISRIGASTFKVQPSVFNASELLKAAVVDGQTLMAEKGQSLKYHLPPGTVWLNADSDRISQLVMNLLTNASKYSAAGTGIELTASWDSRDFRVSVKDSGIGISPEDQSRLFTAFYRADNQATRTVPGTGLGLYISKAIVEMHGGRIWLQSEVGAGTTVHFRIPCVTPAPETECAGPGSQAAVPRSRLYPNDEMDDIPLPAA
jgi:signal transduction histidine kinase